MAAISPARLLSDLAAAPALVELGLHRGQVGEDQLELQRGQGLDRVRVPGHLGVLERPEDHTQRVDLTDAGQEAVPEPLSSGRAGNEAGDVDHFHAGAHHLAAGAHARQGVESGVGQRRGGDRRLGGGEGVGGHRRVSTGEGVEQRRLAGIGQTDETQSFHCSPTLPAPRRPHFGGAELPRTRPPNPPRHRDGAPSATR